ncbi:MAG: tetratricopeptide repeat protein, partial [Chloroflexia bacterium]
MMAEPLALDTEGLEALNALCTALASLRGHPGLLLALYDSPLLRDRLIAEIGARLEGWKLVVLDAGNAPPDLLPWLATEASPEADAVFVTHWENILSVAAKYLNYRREILARLPYPVVFWLPYDKEEELYRLAPDFRAFRRQTFVFRLFAPWLLRVSQKVAEAGLPAETPESRRAGIALLRQLLQDLEAAGAGETVLVARLRRELGDLLRREGRWAESRVELEHALALLGGVADTDTQERADVQYSLGLTLYYLDEHDAALASYEAALGLYRQIGDRLGEANVQKALGDLALREARLSEAR